MSEIEIDGAKTVDKKAICNAFNTSFAEMGKYSGDFVPLNIHRLDHCSEKFNFRVLTVKEIYKTIDSLENSKSPGPGFVHVWALKAAKYAIGAHLQFIFNECIQKGCLSNCSKTCICHTSSQKRINNTSVQISTYLGTPTFAKLFEKLLLFQIMDHINKNNLLNKEQFGFQNKKSSADAVLFFNETVVENHENGQNTAAIFLDLAKAFNSISHKFVFKKAECCNFSEPAVNLLRSSLEERSQCVTIGTQVSEHIFVNHGVPQGTVLGPLNFLLYVNDFSEKIKSDFELVQFADDTSILCQYEPGETIAAKIEKFLLKTDGYLKENQPTLNAHKTELLRNTP